MARSTFKRGNGRSTFPCTICGRLTRDTDQGSTDLCMQCFDLCSLDNQVNDDGRQPTEAEHKQALSWVKQIKAKGGDAERAMLVNTFLFTDVNKKGTIVTESKTTEPTPTTEPTEPKAKPKRKVGNAPKAKVKPEAKKPAPKSKAKAKPEPKAKSKKAKADGRFNIVVGKRNLYLSSAVIKDGKLHGFACTDDAKSAIVYEAKADGAAIKKVLRLFVRCRVVKA